MGRRARFLLVSSVPWVRERERWTHVCEWCSMYCTPASVPRPHRRSRFTHGSLSLSMAWLSGRGGSLGGAVCGWGYITANIEVERW